MPKIRNLFLTLSIAVLTLSAASVAQIVKPQPVKPGPNGSVPVYNVNVVGRSITAVNFAVRGDETSLVLGGTPLLPWAYGKAVVQVGRGSTHIHVQVHQIHPAERFGPQYLTYVLWAVSPDGRTQNLGELWLRSRQATLDVTTHMQEFGLLITAEPYFDVERPSDLVVMQDHVTPHTVGARAAVNAKYLLLRHGQYTRGTGTITPLPTIPKAPLVLYEAENALRIARWSHAAEAQPAIYAKASRQLQEAENLHASHAAAGRVATAARLAVETAEDARLLTRRGKMAQTLASAQTTAREKAAEARQARQEAAQAEALRQAAAASAASANIARRAANSARERAEDRAQEDQARLAEALNTVLTTRTTARGLILSLPDVEFATGEAELRPDAQVKLAKVAGILMTYPKLHITVNGYTDNTGSPNLNLQLSRERAQAVTNFLAIQGVNPTLLRWQGYGASDPVASNDSAAGRQQNRRVELVLTGSAASSGN